jgi:shikimate dehydrogenase
MTVNLKTSTDHYAVFGHPIGHSKSPTIHAAFAKQTGQDIDYVARDVPSEDFDSALRQFLEVEGGRGLNCTVPLKELAFRKAARRTERAELAGAVNTLVLQGDGELLGDNTDGIGLVRDLANVGIQTAGSRILILGAGGACRGILQPLMAANPVSISIANRTPDKAVKLADDFSGLGRIHAYGFEDLQDLQFDLIINASSASLYGELPPIRHDLLASGGACYDLAYGSAPTAFVLWGKAAGAVISQDGIGMLVEQAAEAFYLWRGIRPETQEVIRDLKSMQGK